MNFKKLTRKFISYTDLYATPIEIYIKGEPKHSTVIGSLTSILIISFLCLSSYYLIMDMVNKKNPNLISNTIFSPNPQVNTPSSLYKAYNFTFDQHIFIIAITDQEAIPIINLPNYGIYTIAADLCFRS